QRALARVEKVIVSEPDHGVALGFGVTALATLGERERAREWAENAILLDPENTNLHYNMACAMAMLGAHDKAIEFMRLVFPAAKVQSLRWFATDTSIDPIRNDPRYKEMLAATEKRLGLSS